MDRAQMGGTARRWFKLAVNRRSTIAHHGNPLFAPMKVRPDFFTAPAASGAYAWVPRPTAEPRRPRISEHGDVVAAAEIGAIDQEATGAS
jgi:hypothetical protein